MDSDNSEEVKVLVVQERPAKARSALQTYISITVSLGSLKNPHPRATWLYLPNPLCRQRHVNGRASPTDIVTASQGDGINYANGRSCLISIGASSLKPCSGRAALL